MSEHFTLSSSLMKNHVPIAFFALLGGTCFVPLAHAAPEEALTVSITCYEQGSYTEKTVGQTVTRTQKAILSKITTRTIIDQVGKNQGLLFGTKATLVAVTDTTTGIMQLVVRDQGVDYPIQNSTATETNGAYNATYKSDFTKKIFSGNLSGWFQASYSLGAIQLTGLFSGNATLSGKIATDYSLYDQKASGTSTATISGTDGNGCDYAGTIKMVMTWKP